MEAFLSNRPANDWDAQGYSDEEDDVTKDLSALGMSVTDEKEKEEEEDDVVPVAVDEEPGVPNIEKPPEPEHEDEEPEEGFDELKDLETAAKRLQTDERYTSPIPTEEV